MTMMNLKRRKLVFAPLKQLIWIQLVIVFFLQGIVSAQSPPAVGEPSITVIVDYSKSMKGEPITAAKNSTLTLIDLIEFWKQLYPDKIGRLNFQFIQFGGPNEKNILHPLGPISDTNLLKKSIQRSTAIYNKTDYNSGIDLALAELEKRQLQNNKTLFLTDAADEGPGPVSGKGYERLGETRVIIYGKGSVPKWLSVIPSSAEMNASTEFEVTTTFVASLFEYVDNINRYLVRRGKQKIDPGGTFRFSKHADSQSCNLIITRPLPDIELTSIRDPSGRNLPPETYKLYKGGTFFQIILNPDLLPGAYEISFSKIDRSHYFNYIYFELCDISIGFVTTPKLETGKCFVENSNVNIDFKFRDNTRKVDITYPDFLNFVSYRYAVKGGLAEGIGNDLAKLDVPLTLPPGSSGRHDVLTSWNYNLGKLRNDDPPLKKVGEICIGPSGSLVRIEYGPDNAWEGRDLEFAAGLLDPNPQMLKDLKELNLETGQGVVILRQTTAGANDYRGGLQNLKPGPYRLSLENVHKSYRLALDKSTLTQFNVQKRALIFSIEGMDYSGLKDDEGLWHDLKLGVKDLFGKTESSQKTITYQSAKDLSIPYRIPYSGEFNKQVTIRIKPNKVFADEVLRLEYQLGGDTNFGCKGVQIPWFWGLFHNSTDISDAVQAKFLEAGPVRLSSREEAKQLLHIVKKDGDMLFEQPLYKEPEMKTSGGIELSLPGGYVRRIPLDPTRVVFEITTDPVNMWLTKTVRWGKLLLLLITILTILLVTGAALLIRHSVFNKKLDIWQNECKRRSPEDFFKGFPESIRDQFTGETASRALPGIIQEYEGAEVREKRIFRYKISKQKKDEFDRKIAKECQVEFLEKLSKRLKAPNVDNATWVFSIPPDNVKTVFIRPADQDDDAFTEKYVRVRTGQESDYGSLEIDKQDSCFYSNPYNIVFIRDKRTNRFERIGMGNRTLLSQGDVIRFGPIEDQPYFCAMVSFTASEFTVTISKEA